MKPILHKIILLAFVCSGLVGCGQNRYSKLIWEEEFTGDSLNLASWNYELGNGCPQLCGWGNNERQIYTKTNHLLKDGHLIITAKKEGNTYSSTRITTEGKEEFKYGRIETRAKLPKGKGIWPAFWMLGSNLRTAKWPRCGEIDIMEYVGKKPQELSTSVHTQESYGNTVNTKTTYIEGLEEGFHVFAVEWTVNAMTFLIDSQEVYTYEPEQKTEANWPFNQPFFITLNMAIGGNFGGPQVDDAIFPQEFIVDYIRVYTQE